MDQINDSYQNKRRILIERRYSMHNFIMKRIKNLNNDYMNRHYGILNSSLEKYHNTLNIRGKMKRNNRISSYTSNSNNERSSKRNFRIIIKLPVIHK